MKGAFTPESPLLIASVPDWTKAQARHPSPNEGWTYAKWRGQKGEKKDKGANRLVRMMRKNTK